MSVDEELAANLGVSIDWVAAIRDVLNRDTTGSLKRLLELPEHKIKIVLAYACCIRIRALCAVLMAGPWVWIRFEGDEFLFQTLRTKLFKHLEDDSRFESLRNIANRSLPNRLPSSDADLEWEYGLREALSELEAELAQVCVLEGINPNVPGLKHLFRAEDDEIEFLRSESRKAQRNFERTHITSDPGFRSEGVAPGERSVNRASIVVMRETGNGGNGVVEEVWPGGAATTPVAMKRLKQEDRRDPEVVARFKREVRILRSLDHPHIIQVLDADLESDDPWILMPLAVGSLSDEIAEAKGPLSPERIRSVFGTVTNALAYAHDRDILHRDLNPKNILQMPDGRVVVSDFGLGLRVKDESLRITRTGTGRGTEGYAAPEQLANAAHVDHLADVYALGSLLFEMSTGLNPLVGDPRSVPPVFQGIVQRCRSHDPARRFQSVADLRRDFDLLWSDDEAAVPPAELAVRLMATALVRPTDRLVSRQVCKLRGPRRGRGARPQPTALNRPPAPWAARLRAAAAPSTRR